MDSVLFMSDLVTAMMFALISWFIYRYSSLFPNIERYWIVISLAFVVFGFSGLMKALESFGMVSGNYLVASVLGSVLLLFGFYQLYVTHEV